MLQYLNEQDIVIGRSTMFRALFISLSKAMWAQRLITNLPFAWRAASRFVAGETPAAAIRAVKELNDKGILATLDHLGENTTLPTEAVQATDEILIIIDEINRSGVRSNISIKLSQVGLNLDEGLCRQNLSRILERAKATGNYVRIDMEDSPVTDKTLGLLAWAREQGFTEVGTVIQSYLFRSEADIRTLLSQGVRVRLVKGAYREPASVAFPKKSDVDANYDHLTDVLLDGTLAAASPVISADGRTPPILAVASHDEARIAYARTAARQRSIPESAIEFQMLYGIRRDLQESLARAGYPVRVYVPYGTHWYPYFMRRLAERPANFWFFLSNLFKK